MIIVKAVPFVKRENIEDFLKAAGNITTTVREEEGCLEYKLLTNSENSEDMMFFERWESPAALDAHLKTPHMTEFFKSIENWVTAAPEINVFETK